jgi:hypothetical protein
VEDPQQFDPIHPRHPHVEDEHVGLVPLHGTQRFLTVETTRDDLALRFAAEELFQTVEDERVIVGNDDADRHQPSS